MGRELLVFETSGRCFGIAIEDVERVVPALLPMPLPESPAAIAGLINLGGKAVAVLDLGVWFGKSPRTIALDDLLVVLRVGPRRVALHVEKARGVFSIAASAIQPAESVLPDAKHFCGVVMLGADIVLLPDIADFLAAADSLSLPQVSAA